jgi:hypothetical protein
MLLKVVADDEAPLCVALAEADLLDAQVVAHLGVSREARGSGSNPLADWD